MGLNHQPFDFQSNAQPIELLKLNKHLCNFILYNKNNDDTAFQDILS